MTSLPIKANADSKWTDDSCRRGKLYWLLSPPSATGRQITRGAFMYVMPAGWLRSRRPIPTPKPPPPPAEEVVE